MLSRWGLPRWAFLGKGWHKHCKTTISPLFRRVFLVSKRTPFFGEGLVIWMLHIRSARHPGPGTRYFTPGQLSVEFVNVGGWLTYGDLAMDSCAQFLAVAEHRLIPSGTRSKCHQLRRAGYLSLVSSLSGSGCWWSCWGRGRQSWWCSSCSPLLCYSSVRGVFQVRSCFENHSSYWERRSGSSFCCLWVSGGGRGCGSASAF